MQVTISIRTKRNTPKHISSLISRYVDLINVMTYDLYGAWHNKIGHHSALFHRPGETGMERELNTVRSQKNIDDFSFSLNLCGFM